MALVNGARQALLVCASSENCLHLIIHLFVVKYSSININFSFGQIFFTLKKCELWYAVYVIVKINGNKANCR